MVSHRAKLRYSRRKSGTSGQSQCIDVRSNFCARILSSSLDFGPARALILHMMRVANAVWLLIGAAILAAALGRFVMPSLLYDWIAIVFLGEALFLIIVDSRLGPPRS